MVLNLLFIFSFIYSSIFIDLSVQVTQLHGFVPVPDFVSVGSVPPNGPGPDPDPDPDFCVKFFLLKPVGPGPGGILRIPFTSSL